MSESRRALRTLLRRDLACFVEKTFSTLEPGTAFRPNWHVDHIAYQLERVARGEVRRLIINVPPRSMKSIMVSVAFRPGSWGLTLLAGFCASATHRT